MSTVVLTPTGGFEAALLSDEPRLAMQSEVARLLTRGYSHAELVSILREFRQAIRAQGRYDSEDVILDVMDLLDGWAGPDAVL